MLRTALLMFRSQRLLYCQSQLQDWGQILNDANPSGSTGWRKPCWSVWVKNIACNFCFKSLSKFSVTPWWIFVVMFPWSKLPSDKPFYMVLNSVFSCSLFHGAVMFILTNKQLREENQSKYIILWTLSQLLDPLLIARLCELSETYLLLCSLYSHLGNVMERV